MMIYHRLAFLESPSLTLTRRLSTSVGHGIPRGRTISSQWLWKDSSSLFLDEEIGCRGRGGGGHDCPGSHAGGDQGWDLGPEA